MVTTTSIQGSKSGEVSLLVVTSVPVQFDRWTDFLAAAGIAVRTTAPERQSLAAACSLPPDVLVLHSEATGRELLPLRNLVHEALAGRTAGLIVATSPEAIPAVMDADVDDLVPLTASPEEVHYRVRRLAERLRLEPTPIRVGELIVGPGEGQVVVDGRPLSLCRREYELLKFLASHPDRVFRRCQLVWPVWGPEFAGSRRTVDVLVARLRRRLGSFGQRQLQTVRGVGYRLSSAPLDEG